MLINLLHTNWSPFFQGKKFKPIFPQINFVIYQLMINHDFYNSLWGLAYCHMLYFSLYEVTCFYYFLKEYFSHFMWKVGVFILLVGEYPSPSPYLELVYAYWSLQELVVWMFYPALTVSLYLESLAAAYFYNIQVLVLQFVVCHIVCSQDLYRLQTYRPFSYRNWSHMFLHSI